MDPKLTQTIMQFMQRVNLTGAEVQAYVACMNELQKLLQQSEMPAAPRHTPEIKAPPKPPKAVSPNGPTP